MLERQALGPTINGSRRADGQLAVRRHPLTGGLDLARRRERVREELFQRHLPLAHRIASSFGHSGEELEDLQQVARLALLKALRRYDPSVGASFATFATATVSGELKRHLRDNTWALHVPRGRRELALALLRAEAALLAGGPSGDVNRRLALELGVDEQELVELRLAAAAYRTLPVEPLLEGEEGPLEHPIAARLGEEDPRFEELERAGALRSALSTLPRPQRLAIELYYLAERSQREVAAELGVSQMQVSRLLRKGLAALRAELGGAL